MPARVISSSFDFPYFRVTEAALSRHALGLPSAAFNHSIFSQGGHHVPGKNLGR